MTHPELLLDITRLMRRAKHATPTGIDRVEMAYATHLARTAADRLTYVVMHPGGWHVRLPDSMARRFLADLAQAWDGDASGVWAAVVRLWTVALLSLPRHSKPTTHHRSCIYLLLSHTNLERPASVARALSAERAHLACLIHDIIPLTHPEFMRAGIARTHQRRMETVDALADLVICNSRATLNSISERINRVPWGSRLLAVPLGITAPRPTSPRPETGVPYFVMLGTIEPRKNHLLLLQLWQRLVNLMGLSHAPRLHLVGRNGWENAHIHNLLDRSPALQTVVTLATGVSDREVTGLLQGARALLMPSFAEGYGLPVAEALALGVPVIASDLPALHEAGGGAPDFLDPLDGRAWLQAIQEYMDPLGRRRQAQLARISAWQAPRWEDHFRVVLDAIDRLPHAPQRSVEANYAS